MAFDPQAKNTLDQLTAAATQPPMPPPPAPTETATPLADASAATPGSTANLESLATSPESLAAGIAATKQTEKSQEDQNPGFLKKLARIAGGASGLADPSSSPEAGLGAKLTGLLGRVSGGAAVAAGTPEQKRIAAENSQLPLKIAQIQNEMQYRNGLLGNKAAETGIHQQKANTGDQMADIAQQNADSAENLKRKQMEHLDAQMNGEVLVTPEAAAAAGDRSLEGQRLKTLDYAQRITNPINNQLKAAGGTKTVDLGEDGVWGYNPLLGRTQRLGDSPAVARSNSMLLRTQLPVNDEKGNTLGWVNPQTNSYTPVSSIHTKGGTEPLSNATGSNVIPPKPTSSVLSRGQVAQTILPQIPVIQNEVKTLSDKIGPAAGRWNDFWVNKGGANDPDFAGLNQDLQLYATAIGLAHFGASMPQTFVQDMMKDFGTAQSPEDLQARIEHAEGWVQGYASRIGGNAPKKGTNVPNSSTATPSGKEVSLAAAMALPVNAGKSEADVRADIIKHGHKVGK